MKMNWIFFCSFGRMNYLIFRFSLSSSSLNPISSIHMYAPAFHAFSLKLSSTIRATRTRRKYPGRSIMVRHCLSVTVGLFTTWKGCRFLGTRRRLESSSFGATTFHLCSSQWRSRWTFRTRLGAGSFCISAIFMLQSLTAVAFVPRTAPTFLAKRRSCPMALVTRLV